MGSQKSSPTKAPDSTMPFVHRLTAQRRAHIHVPLPCFELSHLLAHTHVQTPLLTLSNPDAMTGLEEDAASEVTAVLEVEVEL